MKQAHFQVGAHDPALKMSQTATMQKTGFQSYGTVPKPNAEACTAYQLRNGRTNIGSEAKNFPTPFVTSQSLQYKWVQPTINAK